jgi:hypothetical protein
MELERFSAKGWSILIMELGLHSFLIDKWKCQNLGSGSVQLLILQTAMSVLLEENGCNCNMVNVGGSINPMS